MAGFVADKLCPQLIHLPLNFDKYTAKAREVRAVLSQYDPRFESSSIDEAYLNITPYCYEHSVEPEDAVAQLRAHVFQETKITISVGIAANAKMSLTGLLSRTMSHYQTIPQFPVTLPLSTVPT